MGAGARFVARTVDTDQKHMPVILKRAHEHDGASFVEIYQNCIVFNDDVFGDFTNKKVSADRQLRVTHGEKLIFGADGNKGLMLKQGALGLDIVTIGENGVTEDDILVHDETDRVLAQLLLDLGDDDTPVAVGVIYCDPMQTYDGEINRLVTASRESNPNADMKDLLFAGSTWTVS